MKYIDSFEKILGSKQKVMVVMAHPDDAEIYAGGTIAKLIDAKKEVQIIKVTLGDKGSQQQKISQKKLAEVRLKEDIQAMKTLGIKGENNIYLKFEDGSVTNSMEIIKAIAFKIRLFKPDIIITHNPENIIIPFAKDVNWVNHRDHRNTGLSAIDAAYPYSRDILFFPEQLKQIGAVSHICTEFLLVDYYDGRDIVYIDMTDFVEKRIVAQASHTSQYSRKHSEESADFFTKFPGTKRRYERFRYVIAD